jgi:hypothetical protein
MGRRNLRTHDHSGTGTGGKDINPDTIGSQSKPKQINAENIDSDRIDLELAVDNADTISGGDPISIDVTGTGVFEITMDQDANVNLSGADTDGIYTVTLLFEDKGFTPTWDSAIAWEDGNAPSLSDDLIIIQLATRDGGTNWLGRYSGVFTES